ncbi:murein hydrolase activator EnvC family protein [Altererythrobacter sp. GH1-8]|uniref:murein hydrolase activator EnvC family protein n=1 Tax=Altererythrobacter sp. GH1-8 TaxID=3349333 RepID=UPI00374DE06B
MRRWAFPIGIVAAGGLALVALPALTGAQADFAPGARGSEAADARMSLKEAQDAAAAAAERAEALNAEAREASEAEEQTRAQAAALAAQIQQSEAQIAASEARLALIASQRADLDARLAEKSQPLTRLAAALQNMARRPLALSALRPGSLKDTVYVRAVLSTTMPEIRNRTEGLRDDIAEAEALQAQTEMALLELREGEGALEERRAQLNALAAQQRIAARQVRGAAARENERALRLAEQARDLDTLVGQLDAATSLREELAQLPGPILRPARPEDARVDTRPGIGLGGAPSGGPPQMQLPVQGRTITGFGERSADGLRSAGLTLAPRGGAQVVAPARGRIAFAGPYRGYGQIVIIAHSDGWTSLVTGLAAAEVQAGDQVIGGSPLGVAGTQKPRITLELRRKGKAVNPLQYLR